MKPHWIDWTYASVVALALLGLAAFLVFKIPHGFEEQVGWYLALLPASIFAAGISEFIGKLVPREQSLVFRGLLVCFNFIWYFLITFGTIKAYRFASRTSKDFSRR
jgi:hypothetical protein